MSLGPTPTGNSLFKLKRKLGTRVLLETQDSYYKIFKVQDCQKTWNLITV